MPRNVGSSGAPNFAALAGYATPAARDPSLIRHAPDFRMALVGKAQLPQTTTTTTMTTATATATTTATTTTTTTTTLSLIHI